MKWLLLGMIAASLLALPLRAETAPDPSEPVLLNTMWAEQLHRDAAERDTYPTITREWDKDWVLNYIADREIHLGQDVSVEVPDIRAKWERGEYRR